MKERVIMSNFDAAGQFASKKALREAVASLGAANVFVTDTSGFDNRGRVAVSDLRPSDVIVGPDAYQDRRWYANAKTGKDGVVKIV
jgi:hypothetical protein